MSNNMPRQSREKSGTGIYQMIIRTVPLIVEVGAINPSALFTKPLIFTWSILDKPFISPK